MCALHLARLIGMGTAFRLVARFSDRAEIEIKLKHNRMMFARCGCLPRQEPSLAGNRSTSACAVRPKEYLGDGFGRGIENVDVRPLGSRGDGCARSRARRGRYALRAFEHMAAGVARCTRYLPQLDLPDRDLLGTGSHSLVQRCLEGHSRGKASVGVRPPGARGMVRHL